MLLNFSMIFCAVGMIWYFDRLIVLNSVSTLVTGCIWFPQIVHNAKHGVRNTLKLRHVISVQVTISWLTLYMRMNSTGVFKL